LSQSPVIFFRGGVRRCFARGKAERHFYSQDCAPLRGRNGGGRPATFDPRPAAIPIPMAMPISMCPQTP